MRSLKLNSARAFTLSAGLVSSLGASPILGCTRAPASEAAGATAQIAETHPLVGYDLRRLRPRESESLGAMFERLHAQTVADGKHVVMIFSADWCEPCRVLDLELGNMHPSAMIGGVRILELKEEDWNNVARMTEFNDLRTRWEPVVNAYPLVILLDAEAKRVEEMKEAKQRLEDAGLEPTLPIWFETI